MENQNIQPFILKAGDSVNDQPNDNVLNAKMKSLYNEAKSACILKYGTTKMLPHHMNSVLVAAWDFFKFSVGKVIRDSFVKNLPPLIPSDLTTYNQVCDVSAKVSSGAKSE